MTRDSRLDRAQLAAAMIEDMFTQGHTPAAIADRLGAAFAVSLDPVRDGAARRWRVTGHGTTMDAASPGAALWSWSRAILSIWSGATAEKRQ